MTFDAIRFAAAAPFSRRYRGRLRWHLDATKWEPHGIAVKDIRRKAFVVPGTGAVFIAISKAANTSLSFILSTRPGARSDNIHTRRYSPQRLVDTGRCLSDLADGSTPLFTFVRHPVARFWSAYSDMAMSPKRRSGLRRAVAAVVGKPPTADFSPDDVIAYLSNTPAIEVEEHVRPQWSCVGIEHLPITYVGKVERIGVDLEALVARGFLTARQAAALPHFNASAPHSTADCARVDEMLKDIYRKDMELFGYD